VSSVRAPSPVLSQLSRGGIEPSFDGSVHGGLLGEAQCCCNLTQGYLGFEQKAPGGGPVDLGADLLEAAAFRREPPLERAGMQIEQFGDLPLGASIGSDCALERASNPSRNAASRCGMTRGDVGDGLFAKVRLDATHARLQDLAAEVQTGVRLLERNWCVEVSAVGVPVSGGAMWDRNS
jgi:hypothetical protein